MYLMELLRIANPLRIPLILCLYSLLGLLQLPSVLCRYIGLLRIQALYGLQRLPTGQASNCLDCLNHTMCFSSKPKFCTPSLVFLLTHCCPKLLLHVHSNCFVLCRDEVLFCTKFLTCCLASKSHLYSLCYVPHPPTLLGCITLYMYRFELRF